MIARAVLIVSCLLFSMAGACAQAAPTWHIGCEGKAKDQFGDKQRRYCFLAVSNEPLPIVNPDNSYSFKFTVLVEIDRRGARMIAPAKDRLCGKSRLRVAIDGKRIDGMKASEQIAALRTGRWLTQEQEKGWPHCNVAPYGTRLDGIEAELDRLERRWSEVRG